MVYAIEAQQLKKSFGSYEALREVDLTVRPGEIFALLGPNGAGKTTTIRMLTTLLRPDSGTARICGYDIVSDAEEVRRRITVTGQYTALDEALTGFQNLFLFAGLHGYSRKEARSLAEELLHSFGLTEAIGRTVATYSGGMRRRLDLAAAILARPEVMFLDEPTTGLDSRSRYELWDLIRQLAKHGTTVLLTTQYLEEADQLADRIGFIIEGRIIAVDTPEQLKVSTGDKVLTIRLGARANPENTLRLLADELGMIGHLQMDGALLKVSVQYATLAHRIIGTLLSSAIAIDDYNLSNPSLDDVFLALTDTWGKEAARTS